VLIPNALQPAAISDVFTYPRLGRAIVLVEDDQLSLAIGRRGQNVRLASKLVGLDLEIMTHEELGESLERAERWFRQLPHCGEEQVQALIEEGFLSYNEITFVDGQELALFMKLELEQCNEIVDYAEEYARMMDDSVEEERRQVEEAAAAEQAAQAEADAAAAEAEALAQAEALAANPPAEEAPSEGEPVATEAPSEESPTAKVEVEATASEQEPTAEAHPPEEAPN